MLNATTINNRDGVFTHRQDAALREFFTATGIRIIASKVRQAPSLDRFAVTSE